MINFLDEPQDDLMAVMVTGKLKKADYDNLLPVLEEKIKKYGKINLYWEMQNFEGWDLSAAWQDLKLDLKHANHFRRVAMVGDKSWEQRLTQLMKAFSKADVRYFGRSDAMQAKQWVKAAVA